MANDTLNKLKKLFRIDVKTVDNNKKVVPIEVDKDTKTGKIKTSVVKFPSDLEKWVDYYFNKVLGGSESVRQRINRYKEIDYMRYVEPIISYSIELYANETSQADVQDNIFTFSSKDKKFTDYLYELVYDKWNFNQNWVKEIANNLVSYGDSFMINNIDDKYGITEFVPIDPYLVKERIELNLSKVRFTDNNGIDYMAYVNNMASQDTRMKALLDMLETKNDISKYFKSYLFGYVIDPNLTLPPWAVTHFRLFTNKSEFYPYGRSLLINSISPYRQLQASKNLMVMARASKFPKEFFQVKVSENMDESEQWEAVNDARQEYLNLAQSQSDKEQNGVGTQIWAPEGLLNIGLIENNMRLEDIGDIELLEESLVRSTGVPFDYIVQRQGGYTSGIALTMQSKPFARKIYTIQTAIIKELMQNIRIHLMITNDFPYDTPFEMYMNFPNVEDSRDRIGIKNDTLRLAKDVIDNLSQSLGLDRDENLPVEIVKDIFSKYSFIDIDDLNEWEKIYKKEQEKNKVDLSENKRLVNRINSLDEEVIGEIYFKSVSKLGLYEGVKGQKHYCNSLGISKDEQIILDAIKKGGSKSLRESVYKSNVFEG